VNGVMSVGTGINVGSQYALTLAGKEFYPTGPANNYTGIIGTGVSLVPFVNRPGDKALGIIDPDTVINNTNKVIRIWPNKGQIDCVATDGATQQILNLQGVKIDTEGNITANNLTANNSTANNLTANNSTANNITANNSLNVNGLISANSLNVNGVISANSLNVNGLISANNNSLNVNALTTPTSTTKLTYNNLSSSPPEWVFRGFQPTSKTLSFLWIVPVSCYLDSVFFLARYEVNSTITINITINDVSVYSNSSNLPGSTMNVGTQISLEGWSNIYINANEKLSITCGFTTSTPNQSLYCPYTYGDNTVLPIEITYFIANPQTTYSTLNNNTISTTMNKLNVSDPNTYKLLGIESTMFTYNQAQTVGAAIRFYNVQNGTMNQGYHFYRGLFRGSEIRFATCAPNTSDNASGVIGAVDRMKIDPYGNVYINNNVTANNIYANNCVGTGNRTVYSAADGMLTNNASDITLKKNINSLENSLELMKQLNPVSYYWKTDVNNETLNYGFIAQEVNNVLPNICFTINNQKYDGPKMGYEPSALIPFLVNSIKELHVIISKQQDQINNLTQHLKYNM